MTVKCVWEHNRNDTLLYAVDYIGAYTRGENLDVAIKKMPNEIKSYLMWRGENDIENIEIAIVEEKESELDIKDADSDFLFEGEIKTLTMQEYTTLKNLALKSAKDYIVLFESMPDPDKSNLPFRKTFYGQVPRTAREMYEHTKNVNEYYFAEINVSADNDGDIYECRKRGFETLECKPDFLKNTIFEGSYGESWTLRKVIRRFIWHDRIHAKAMYKMAKSMFGEAEIKNPFYF